MKAKHIKKVEGRVYLVRMLTLENEKLPNFLKQIHGMNSGEIHDTMAALRKLFNEDIPCLIKEASHYRPYNG